MQAHYFNPRSISIHFKGFSYASFEVGIPGILFTISVAGLGLSEPLRIAWPMLEEESSTM